MTDRNSPYRRVLLKLSGEALMGELDYGIEPGTIKRIASEIATARKHGVEIAIVVGGGNIFRGAGLARAGMDRVTGDHMGMLATVMNALALKDGQLSGTVTGTIDKQETTVTIDGRHLAA